MNVPSDGGRPILADAATSSDELGFGPYARRSARDLLHRETETPIVTSIEAPWGGGKTSFLQMMQMEIRESEPRARVLWFSPWMYEEPEHLWAAFAARFRQEMRRETGFYGYAWMTIRSRLAAAWSVLRDLTSSRSARARVRDWIAAGVLLCVLLGVGVALYSAWKPIFAHFSVSALTFTTIAALLTASLPVLHQAIVLYPKNSGPGSRQHLSILDSFQADFDVLVRRFCRRRSPRTFVMIDDFDRCKPPIVAATIRALNSVLTNHAKNEGANVVFLLAMDRPKIAKAICNEMDGGTDKPGGATTHDFGHEYLEKFIQHTILLPRPREDTAVSFIKAYASGEGLRYQPFKSATGLVESIYRILEGNPRRLKRFINAYQSFADGLEENGRLTRQRGAGVVTPEQLFVVTAFVQRFPGLLHHLVVRPDLFDLMHQCANCNLMPDPELEEETQWCTEWIWARINHAGADRALNYAEDVHQGAVLSGFDATPLVRVMNPLGPDADSGALPIDPDKGPGTDDKHDGPPENPTLKDRADRVGGTGREPEGDREPAPIEAARHARARIDKLAKRGRDADPMDEFDAQFSLLRALFEAGRYSEALDQGERLLKHSAELAIERTQVAELYSLLGTISNRLASHEKAMYYFQHALDLGRTAYGNAHPAVAVELNNMGQVLETTGDLAGALTKYKEAEQVLRAAHGDDHPSIATSVNGIGNVLFRQGDLAGALAKFEEAERINRAAYGHDHPEVATDVNNIGSVLKARGDLAGALARFEEAERIDRAAFGDDHPNVARDVNNIGTVLWDRGDLAGALAKYQEAERIDRAAFGNDHPSVAIRVNNIGLVLQGRGDLAGALARFEEAERIDRAAFGDDHPSVANDVNNIGGVLKAQRDLAGALVKYQEAERINRAAYGDDHPMVAIDVNNIGTVLKAQGDLAGALANYEEAFGILLGAFGPRARDTVGVAANLLSLGVDPVARARELAGEEVAAALREALRERYGE